ncbi:hypothetical protein [Marisediminicola sp. LYQ134]|uniref:hypothetical protein n=1 Tax=unclassified Marisediminicola TaxID=2618316 RepID=UPI003983D81C
MLTQTTAVLAMLLGAFLAAVALPLVAVVILEGIVSVIRRAGIRTLIIGVFVTAGVAAASYFLWTFGVGELAGEADDDAYIQSIRDLVRTILNYTVPLALVIFGIRLLVLGARRRRQRSLERFEEEYAPRR